MAPHKGKSRSEDYSYHGGSVPKRHKPQVASLGACRGSKQGWVNTAGRVCFLDQGLTSESSLCLSDPKQQFWEHLQQQGCASPCVTDGWQKQPAGEESSLCSQASAGPAARSINQMATSSTDFAGHCTSPPFVKVGPVRVDFTFSGQPLCLHLYLHLGLKLGRACAVAVGCAAIAGSADRDGELWAA